MVIMIQCHTFNSLTRMDLREGGPYVLSQFVGGMAAPLFLFMAGMTFGFPDGEPGTPRAASAAALAGLAAARRLHSGNRLHVPLHQFRWPASRMPTRNEMIKVDILNCMGLGMIAFSVAAVFDAGAAPASPLAAGLGDRRRCPDRCQPAMERRPGAAARIPGAGIRGAADFAFFPCAAYIGFGMAAGTIVKRAAAGALGTPDAVVGADRLRTGLQRPILLQHSRIRIYTKSSFWTDSPALILIRVGISLL